MKRKSFLPYRRKREGKTDYKRRLTMLKSHTLRLVVRKSLKNITAQIIDFDPNGDKTLVSASTKELARQGWKGNMRNIPAAYLVGLMCGAKAKQKGINNAIFDLGLFNSKSGTVLYSVLKGVIDSGIEIPHDPKMFPSEERLKGSHISEDVVKKFEGIREKIQK